MTREESCSTCYYFEESDARSYQGAINQVTRPHSTCRRYAPQGDAGAWPWVRSDEWCGDYVLDSKKAKA